MTYPAVEFSPQANQVTYAGGLEAKFGVVKNVDSKDTTVVVELSFMVAQDAQVRDGVTVTAEIGGLVIGGLTFNIGNKVQDCSVQQYYRTALAPRCFNHLFLCRGCGHMLRCLLRFAGPPPPHTHTHTSHLIVVRDFLCLWYSSEDNQGGKNYFWCWLVAQ